VFEWAGKLWHAGFVELFSPSYVGDGRRGARRDEMRRKWGRDALTGGKANIERVVDVDQVIERRRGASRDEFFDTGGW
jgi:hypothetical protein